MVLPALEVVIGALGKAQVLLEYFAQIFCFLQHDQALGGS